MSLLLGAGHMARLKRLAQDFFSASSGTAIDGRTPDIGAAWVASSGTWIIDSSGARNNGTNADAIITINVGRTDYDASVHLTSGISSASLFAGLIVRGDSDGRAILVEIESDDDIAAYTRTSLGAYTVISSVAFNFTSGNDYVLRVTCQSSNFQVFVNGTSQFEFVSDFVGTSGPRVGMRMDTQGAGTSAYLFDRFEVDP